MNIARKRFFRLLFCIFFSVFSFQVNAGIVFSGLDLSSGNRLLFRAASGNGGTAVQDALFSVPLPGSAPDGAGNRLRQLTAFPGKIDLLENGKTLQIRNAFGILRLPVSGGLPVPVPGFPSFAGGSPAAVGRTEEMIASGDGRWLLYLDPVSPALGNMVMVDVLSGTAVQVASRLERPDKIFPAAWSPDSRFFIYEKDGKLYYHMAGLPAMPSGEDTRLIGSGSVSSVCWGKGSVFFYLRGSTLYRVQGAELFARTLYADFLEIGTVLGELPFEFDPAFDRFWVAPDARSLLVSKNRRSLFYYPVGMDAGAPEFLLPCLMLPRSCSGLTVLWSQAGTVTVLVSKPAGDGTEAESYRLKPGAEGVFEHLPLQGPGTGSFHSGSLSPEGDLALFWGSGGILLYDYINWKPVEVISVRPGEACLWTGNREFIAGDDQKTARFLLGPAPEGGGTPAVTGNSLVCLSRAEQAGFEEKTFRVLAKSGDTWYATDGESPWVPVDTPRLRKPSQASVQYRVYLEKQGAGFYANLPMVRNAVSAGTVPLFPRAEPPGQVSPAPAGPGSLPETPYIPGAVFNRGARTGPKEAAICFDLYDDDQGLPETLEALNRSGIKATFFLNGGFIRRHPLAVMDIARAGHEAASMFFAPIDLTGARFRPDPDFIARGLARNEDEYYRVTGKELALLWHPPWYSVSTEAAAAAARAGYITTGRSMDPADWVSREDAERLGIPRIPPAEMIDRIMETVTPGSIIPIRLGRLSGGRDGYLFSRINVLIDALVREGYALTTVSGLLERGR